MIRVEDVCRDDFERVWQRWCELVAKQMDQDCDKLYALQPWQFFEAMEYLVDIICVQLGMPVPIGVSFSVMNSIEEPCECELLLVWNMVGMPKPSLDTNVLVPGKVMRLSEFHWPGRRPMSYGPQVDDKVVIPTIKNWIWRLSVVKDIMKGTI